MSNWCWTRVSTRSVMGQWALVGMIVTLTVSSAAGQNFQFPHRPFGLGAVSASANNAKAEVKQTADRMRLDYDRNAAWPTPFREMDRSTYYEWFQPCLDRGWETELALSDACFDEAGKLNRLGAAKVVQAVRHSPQDRRSVFVWAETPEIAQARVEAVQQHVQLEFGRSANLMVVSTPNYPVTGRGSYAETVTRNFRENLPLPVLNAQAITGAVSGN